MTHSINISKPAIEWLSARASEMGTSIEEELNNAIALSMRLDGYRVMTRGKSTKPMDGKKTDNVESLANKWANKAKSDLGVEKIGASMLYERFLEENNVSKMQMSQAAFGRIALRHFIKKRYSDGYYYLV